MIGISEVITGVVAVIIGVVLIGLVALPIINSVIDQMADGNDVLKTLFGMAAIMLGVVILVFPIYLLSKSGDR